MKKTMKLLFLAIVGITLSTSSYAGDIGVRAGYGLSWWSGMDVKLENVSHSPYVGFVKNFRLAPTLMLGTGVDYHMTGIRYEDEGTLAQHNLSVPLMLRLGLGPLVLHAGGHGAVAPVTLLPNGDTGDSDVYEMFDYGVLAGIGFQIAIVEIGTRVYINQLPRIKSEGFDDVQSRIIQVGATVKF